MKKQVEFLDKQLLEVKRVVIYGAGMVGELVFKYLTNCGYKEKQMCFATSKKPENNRFHDVEVKILSEVLDVAKKDETLIIIAALENAGNEMKVTLDNLGFDNYVQVTKELYNEMAEVYIECYMGQHTIQSDVDVLFFASDNNKTSGAFRCMVEFVSYAVEQGVRIVVVLPKYGNGEQILKDSGIDYIFIPSDDWLIRQDGKSTWDEINKNDDSKACSTIYSFIKKYNVRLVHCNTIYTYVGAKVARQMNVPYIWHIRENIWQQGFDFENETEAFKLINKSNTVIAVSDYVSNQYKLLDKKKCKIVYDGICVEKYYQKHSILESESVNIALVGAIYELKGQKDIIEASYLLKKRGIQFHVDIVGAGEAEYMNNLQQMVQNLELEAEITFKGLNDKIANIYKETDISLVCSRSEAFGRVCVESQVSGCLVMGADRGATLELIEDNINGFLYECGNSLDLANKIELAIKNKASSIENAVYGQQYAVQNYTLKKNADSILHVYREMGIRSGMNQSTK